MNIFDLGPEPTWWPCPRCRTEHALRDTVCWDCEAKDAAAQLRRKVINESLLSIPDAMCWAKLSAPELAQRVDGGKSAEHIENAAKAFRSARVVFSGPAGKGKTSLACAMFRAFVETTGRPARFVPAVRLASGRFVLEDEMLTVPLVLLDDVGMDRAQANNLVADLVYERHAQGLATWATTGLSRAQLTERYGDGIVRRLCERAVIFRLGGIDA